MGLSENVTDEEEVYTDLGWQRGASSDSTVVQDVSPTDSSRGSHIFPPPRLLCTAGNC